MTYNAEELGEQEMSKPEWHDWPREPWLPDVGGQGVWLRDADGKFVSLETYRDRIMACVNALAGIRNPEAAGRVIEAGRALLCSLGREPGDEAIDAEWLTEALAALDQEPEA